MFVFINLNGRYMFRFGDTYPQILIEEFVTIKICLTEMHYTCKENELGQIYMELKGGDATKWNMSQQIKVVSSKIFSRKMV